MKDQVAISYRYATDEGPVEGTWTGDPLTAFWQGQSAVQARPHKDDLIAGFWQTRWIYRPDELDQPDELDEPITVSADALAQLGAGLLDGHSYEELRDCWCADTWVALEGGESLPEPTLLDLIEVIDDGERLTALEEGLKRCDGCRHFQKSSPTGELSALVGWCSLPGDSGAVRTSFCCDDWAPAEPDDEPVPYWPTEPGAPGSRYTRDGANRITMGEVVRRVADKFNPDDISAACDLLDELLLDGAWAHVLGPDGRNCPHDSELIKKDLRGLAVAMFEEGQRRAGISAGVPGQLDKRNELVQRVIEFRDARDGDGDGDLEEQRMFDVLAEITGESPPDEPPETCSWCDERKRIGKGPCPGHVEPGKSPTEPGGTPPDAELLESLRSLTAERNHLADECNRGRETLQKLTRLARQLTEQGELPGGYKLLRIKTSAHDELCALLTELSD